LDTAVFDREYREFGVEANRLEVEIATRTGPSSDSRRLFHRARDLLTIRYFQLRDSLSDGLLKGNAGSEHSSLSVAELKIPLKVRTRYRKTMLELAERLPRERILLGNMDGQGGEGE